VPASGRAESRTRKKGRLSWFVLALIRLKAHVEHALRPEGFYFRVQLGTFERRGTAPGG
jgi:hypothetical protein